jgi:hypothetical protein
MWYYPRSALPKAERGVTFAGPLPWYTCLSAYAEKEHE